MALDFLQLLSTIPDPRRPHGGKQLLGPTLLATILGVLSGANSYRKVHGFIEARLDVLNTAFGFGWKAALAYSTVRSILQGLDAAEVVAIDGKTLRHSFDAFSDQKAAHVFSAFASGAALILGHLEMDEKSTEIPAAQALIEALDLKGKLLTLDAMRDPNFFA